MKKISTTFLALLLTATAGIIGLSTEGSVIDDGAAEIYKPPAPITESWDYLKDNYADGAKAFEDAGIPIAKALEPFFAGVDIIVRPIAKIADTINFTAFERSNENV